MTPQEFHTRILLPAIAVFPFKDSAESRALLLAIAGQESFWTDRLQEAGGPARGFWQFEMGGAVKGVYNHPASAPILKQFCKDWEIEFNIAAIYEAIAWCDALAYACARLLLWTDREPLPVIGQINASWVYYIRNWNPGKPIQITWPARYVSASTILGGIAVV
jgi:hypothetical protein